MGEERLSPARPQKLSRMNVLPKLHPPPPPLPSPWREEGPGPYGPGLLSCVGTAGCGVLLRVL